MYDERNAEDGAGSDRVVGCLVGLLVLLIAAVALVGLWAAAGR
jgi:hypothetical protein